LYNIKFIIRHKLVRINEDGIVLENTVNGQRSNEKIDQVVLSVGVRCNNQLVKELEPHFARLYTIGDARKVGRIAQAVRDGFDTGWNLM